MMNPMAVHMSIIAVAAMEYNLVIRQLKVLSLMTVLLVLVVSVMPSVVITVVADLEYLTLMIQHTHPVRISDIHDS